MEVVSDRFDAELLDRPVWKVWMRPGGEAPSAAAIAELQALCGGEHGLICAFAECRYETNALFQDLGFRLISVRSTYEGALPKSCVAPPLAPDVTVQRLSDGRLALEHSDVIALARVLVATSRYFKDGQISEADALRVYVRWIENALLNGYADDAALAYEGGRLIGLNTLRFSDEVATIDLIGVSEAHQECGLGRALMHEGTAICRAAGCSRLRVVTEAENVGACRFYERYGLLLAATELVWHKHLTSLLRG